MDREEFLDGLARALRTVGMPEREIQDNVNYYESYFRQQMAAGRTQAEILEELGDPRLLARTIAGVREEDSYSQMYEDEAGSSDHGTGSYADGQNRYMRSGQEDSWNGRYHKFQINSGLGCLLIAIVVFLIFSIIFTIIRGLFFLAAPVLVPLLLIVLAVRLFMRR